MSKTRTTTLTIQEFLGERFAAEEVAWNAGLRMVPQRWFADLAEAALADLDAKRKILAHMRQREAHTQFTTSDLTILCMLAEPYSKHRDYQPGWAV